MTLFLTPSQAQAMNFAVEKLAITLVFGLVTLTQAQAQVQAGSHLDGWQPCPDVLSQEAATPPTSRWDLTLSPYTHHWKPSKEHKNVTLVAIDSRTPGNGFCGLAAFSNSFGQPSFYAYAGQRWDGLLGNPRLFTKVSFGVIYGYKGPYKNEIGLNALGLAPVIIPSLGYDITTKHSAQVFLLGTAGVLFAYVVGF